MSAECHGCQEKYDCEWCSCQNCTMRTTCPSPSMYSECGGPFLTIKPVNAEQRLAAVIEKLNELSEEDWAKNPVVVDSIAALKDLAEPK